jgi:Uma2 family endonuclease
LKAGAASPNIGAAGEPSPVASYRLGTSMEAKVRIADGTPRLTREEFRAWVAQQPRGRYERRDERVVAMSPERIGHALVKGRVWRALDRALLDAGATCVAIPDGATVEIDEATEYEPDVVVTCGETLDLEAVAAPRPMVVVEVTSPSTRDADAGDKLADYFRVPSIQHHLIVGARRRQAVHHVRREDGIETRIVTAGSIALDPPGISVALDDFYAGLDL